MILAVNHLTTLLPVRGTGIRMYVANQERESQANSVQPLNQEDCHRQER